MIRGDACDVCRTNLVGARMVLRSEQGTYDCGSRWGVTAIPR